MGCEQTSNNLRVHVQYNTTCFMLCIFRFWVWEDCLGFLWDFFAYGFITLRILQYRITWFAQYIFKCGCQNHNDNTYANTCCTAYETEQQQVKINQTETTKIPHKPHTKQPPQKNTLKLLCIICHHLTGHPLTRHQKLGVDVHQVSLNTPTTHIMLDKLINQSHKCFYQNPHIIWIYLKRLIGTW